MNNIKVTQNNITRILDVFDQISKFCATEKDLSYGFNLSKPEILALESIYQKNELIMSQLAKNLDIGFSTATKIIDRLLDKNLVIRESDPGDRRIVKVVLTKKGNQFVILHRNHKKEIFEKILSILTLDEQENFITIMEKIAKTGESELKL
ncbi:MAG: MarR family transcriptional regulator [Methanosarcinales archaeon]|nr:MarR family transcriptional regulator [Methanosarcinales archaeon]